jgi:flagellar capping protein FliD
MAGISFSGLASGLDTDVIIESLLAQRQQRVNRVNESLSSIKTQKNRFNRP